MFIPVSEKQIIKQFTAIPVMIIGGESLVLALILQSSLFQILAGCAALMVVTVFVFWLDVKHKGLLSKGYFILSIAIFISSLIISI